MASWPDNVCDVQPDAAFADEDQSDDDEDAANGDVTVGEEREVRVR
jgi:hypothetical protein